MPSLLRKSRPKSEVETVIPLQPSLSLADLTTPLLDPVSWEELPSFSPPVSTHPLEPRHRKASLVKLGAREAPGGPILFHRPFTPWQVVNAPQTGKLWEGKDEPDAFRAGAGQARWGTESGVSEASLRGVRKRKGRNKAAERLNVVVTGGKGVGKTR